MYRKITKADALNYFYQYELPKVKAEFEQDGIIDKPARREAWNNYTDALHRNKVITDWQVENWSSPMPQ